MSQSGRGPESQNSAPARAQVPSNVCTSPDQRGRTTRGAGRCRWSAAELDQRAEVIATRWAAVTGHDVKLEDALAVAKLSLPIAAVTKVLRDTWQKSTGLGLCWPALRAAEKAYLDCELTRKPA